MSEVVVLADGLDFPEGPAFDLAGTLWAVEVKGGGLIRWTEEGLLRIPVEGNPNGIAIDGKGRIVFADSGQQSIRRYHAPTGSIETLASEVQGAPLDKPNDLAFDAVGNLIFTCPGNSRTVPTGYVAVRTVDGEVRKVAENFYFPNGLAFSPDGSELIVAETYRQRLWRGKWDSQKASWIAPEMWSTGLDGVPGPDGMAFAEDGTLYVAVYGSSTIMCIDNGGRIVERIGVPGKNPTNCAFDPSGRFGLVVTEAENGLLLSIPGRGVGIPLLGK